MTSITDHLCRLRCLSAGAGLAGRQTSKLIAQCTHWSLLCWRLAMLLDKTISRGERRQVRPPQARKQARKRKAAEGAGGGGQGDAEASWQSDAPWRPFDRERDLQVFSPEPRCAMGSISWKCMLA